MTALLAAVLLLQGPDPLEARARAFVAALVAGDSDAAARDFDGPMQKALPAEKLKSTWQGLLAQVGPLREVQRVRRQQSGGRDVVRVTCRFEKAALDVRLVYTAERKVTGLRFTPVEPDPSEFLTPPYADPAKFREVELTVNAGGDWPLPATLTLPKGSGPFPGVVLVHGSGPNDRDETIHRTKAFRDLAWGLASRGVAVLRYEKRTKALGAKLVEQVGDKLTVQEEVIDDARSAVALLQKQEGIDPKRVFLLGHSLGGMLAPRIAQQAPGLAGVIVLAGTARPLEDVVVEQVVYLDSLDGEPSAARKFAHEILRGQARKVKSPDLKASTPAAELPLKLPAAYWLSLRGYDPPAVAAGLDLPILVLQGERDYQVTMADFALWQKALAGKPNAAFRNYPKLNHLFRPGEGKSRPAEHEPAGNVAEEVVRDIADWVRGH
jgi:dienelactone hydrolase